MTNNANMRGRRMVHLAGFAVVLGAAVAGAGAVASASSARVTARATDVVVRTGAAHPLSADGDTRAVIISLRLPAGKWVLSAAGDLVNFGPSDYTRCQLVVRGHEVGAVSTIVGDPAPPESQGAAGFLSTFTVSAGIALSAPSTASLQCWHDNTNGASVYVDPGSTLVAHKTRSLQSVTR
jgi:hypothetical protein